MMASKRTGLRIASGLAAAGAAIFVLTASKCESQTTFPAYVAEICTDNIDNDGDGKTDCQDTDCAGACAIEVTINPIASPVRADTLAISGSQANAMQVTIVSVSPNGTPGAVTLNGKAWTATLGNLTQRAEYTITVVGSNGSLRDTVTATFTRAD